MNPNAALIPSIPYTLPTASAMTVLENMRKFEIRIFVSVNWSQVIFLDSRSSYSPRLPIPCWGQVPSTGSWSLSCLTTPLIACKSPENTPPALPQPDTSLCSVLPRWCGRVPAGCKEPQAVQGISSSAGTQQAKTFRTAGHWSRGTISVISRNSSQVQRTHPTGEAQLRSTALQLEAPSEAQDISDAKTCRCHLLQAPQKIWDIYRTWHQCCCIPSKEALSDWAVLRHR